jgi:hypothetical protein
LGKNKRDANQKKLAWAAKRGWLFNIFFVTAVHVLISNVVVSYAVGSGLKSRTAGRLTGPTGFVVLLRTFRQIPG